MDVDEEPKEVDEQASKKVKLSKEEKKALKKAKKEAAKKVGYLIALQTVHDTHRPSSRTNNPR